MEKPFIIELRTGECFSCQRLEPTPHGLIARNVARTEQSVEIKDLSEIANIYEAEDRRLNAGDLVADGAATLPGFEKVVQSFARHKQIDLADFPSPILFGSASLALTVLPGRQSQGIDIAWIEELGLAQAAFSRERA